MDENRAEVPRQSRHCLHIRGARHHNLKGIDLDLPLGQIIVVTGPSGSGKSTLALDVLYAEGQHRYLDSLAVDIRRFLHLWDRPQVETIEGIPPAIALEQRPTIHNPRSTVATLIDLADLLRLLFSTSGRPHCPICERAITALTIDQMADRLIDLSPGTRLTLLAPLNHMRANMSTEKILRGLGKNGFRRIRVDGRPMTLDEPLRVNQAPKALEVIVDRLVVKPGLLPRLSDSLGLALRLGAGSAIVDATPQGPQREPVTWTFSEHLSCPSCELSLPTLSPRLFSRSNPAGACPACQGTARSGLPAHCADCEGTGLNAFARNVRLGNLTLPQVLQLSIDRAHKDLSVLVTTRGAGEETLPPAALRILEELHRRLAPVEAMGVGYLTLDRLSASLSGGEVQRLRLAGQLGRHMTGVLYILDEPTVGLHPREQEGLWALLEALKSEGNTILLVEHDLAIIRRADLVVELGPKGGTEGGELIHVGPPSTLIEAPRSSTGPYLQGSRHLRRHEPRGPKGQAILRIARRHNIQGLTVTLPLGCLVCVTGVSGAGKSTLIDCLYQVVRTYLQQNRHRDEADNMTLAWDGAYRPEDVLKVDQASLARTAFSTPATSIGVFAPIRALFARTPSARQRGYGPGHFSLTRKGGRCEHCQGRGSLAIDLHFLPAVTVPCDVCNGRRFNRDALEVKYRGETISDILEMTVREAADFFSRFPSIRRPLEALERIGLGYLTLGRATASLSGGESQRLKLAREFAKGTRGRTIYLLDEPSRGLHQSDLDRLFGILDELLAGGHSVVLIEHQPEILALADWIIELGPGGGPDGGRVIAEGPPAVVVTRGSPTAPYLASALSVNLGVR